MDEHSGEARFCVAVHEAAIGTKRTSRGVYPFVRFRGDCVAKVFLAFGRETLIQDRARTSNNDSKEPTHRFDCYKFLFHRACLATFATQSGTKRTYPIMRLRPLRSLVTHSGHRPPLLILTGCKIVLFRDPRQFRYPCDPALAGGKSPLLRESRMLRRLL